MPNLILGHRPNDTQQPIVLQSDLRRQHMVVCGKAAGKSMLAALAVQDIRAGAGLCFLGDTGNLLPYLPKRRINEFVYISPVADQDPIGLNVLERRPGQPTHLVVSELVSSIRSQFSESWGPQSEFLLAMAAAAVIDSGGTLHDVFHMLVSPNFRARIVGSIHTPMVQMFWRDVFAKWPASFQSTSCAPLVNKLGIFLMDPAMLSIFGQRQSTIDFKKLLNSRAVIFIDLATSRIGQQQARLFGSLALTQLFSAAKNLQSQPEYERQDFSVFVEQVEDFTTDALPAMLDSRLGLNLTLNFSSFANLDERTKNAILGVGTFATFRVGGEDARELEKIFRPQFLEDYLSQRLDDQHLVYRVQGHGLAGLPATATTLPLPEKLGDEADPETLLRISRERYARPRAQVEQELAQRWTLTGSGKQKGPR